MAVLLCNAMPPLSPLDRPEGRSRLWPLSVEAYHALGAAGLIPERTELLYGFVFNKMPKSPLHSFLAERLRRFLEAVLSSGYLVRMAQPVTIDRSEPEPDLAVVAGSYEDFRDRHPTTAEIVIEIAVTSEEYDHDKAAAYAAAGIKEFWLVLALQRQIEVYSQPENGGYTLHRVMQGDELATSVAVPGFTVSPAGLLSK